MTRDHNNCPICGVNAYQATSQTQNVGEILNRWQEEMGIHFSLKTWNRYTETGSLQVTLFHCFNCGYSAFEPRIVGSNEFYSEIAIKDYYFP